MTDECDFMVKRKGEFWKCGLEDDYCLTPYHPKKCTRHEKILEKGRIVNE